MAGRRRRSVRGNPIPISSESSETGAFGRRDREREPAEAEMLRLGTRNARRREQTLRGLQTDPGQWGLVATPAPISLWARARDRTWCAAKALYSAPSQVAPARLVPPIRGSRSNPAAWPPIDSPARRRNPPFGRGRPALRKSVPSWILPSNRTGRGPRLGPGGRSWKPTRRFRPAVRPVRTGRQGRICPIFDT